MPVYFKFPFVLQGKGVVVPTDEIWTPQGTSICPSIRKAIDIIIRNNELIDVFHDIRAIEPMNEIHVRISELIKILIFTNSF